MRAYSMTSEGKARRAAWRETPEGKAKIANQNRIYYAKPEGKAKIYCRQNKTNYEETINWFLIPIEDRCCWLCGGDGEGLMLDHDHGTLEIRGWAHHHCNTAEGYIMKSPNPARLLETLTSMK